jgi:hypothetical protein
VPAADGAAAASAAGKVLRDPKSSKSRKGNSTGCENQKALDYCGASHAELWRIQYSYEEVQRPDGQVVWVPRAPVAAVNAAVSVCADALTYPVARALAPLAAEHRAPSSITSGSRCGPR